MKVRSMNIRLANESDLPQLVAISEAAGSAAHWTHQQWLDIFRTQSPARLAWIADEITEDCNSGERVRGIGFLVAQNGGPEWELENIAVLPEFRCRGVGFALLSALQTHARSLLAERILLEVRASNESAIRFYRKSGFQLLAQRHDYYRNPTENALILVHSLEI
jgi:[ribosomal protein S18]-alanine N-acetyltransferase